MSFNQIKSKRIYSLKSQGLFWTVLNKNSIQIKFKADYSSSSSFEGWFQNIPLINFFSVKKNHRVTFGCLRVIFNTIKLLSDFFIHTLSYKLLRAIINDNCNICCFARYLNKMPFSSGVRRFFSVKIYC